MPLRIGEEQVAADETTVIGELVALQVAIMPKQTDPIRRAQHPKHHGFVKARFSVRDDIPEPYRKGLFAEPRTYDAVVRWSNAGSDDDTKPEVHGMAVKVLAVNGPRSVPDDGRDDQDFVLIDHEVFFARDPKTILAFMKARVAAAAGNPAVMQEFAKNDLETVRLAEASRTTIASPLGVRYWSTVPYKLGDGAVKYTAVPAPDNGAGGEGALSKDGLREALVRHLSDANKPAVFELFVIPQTDSEKMPVENPTIPWTSEPVPVAAIVVEPQTFDTPERMTEAERISFDPWHSLAEHRPLGGINRARKAVYEASVATRQPAARAASAGAGTAGGSQG
jgi:hypothetical protein